MRSIAIRSSCAILKKREAQYPIITQSFQWLVPSRKLGGYPWVGRRARGGGGVGRRPGSGGRGRVVSSLEIVKRTQRKAAKLAKTTKEAQQKQQKPESDYKKRKRLSLEQSQREAKVAKTTDSEEPEQKQEKQEPEDSTDNTQGEAKLTKTTEDAEQEQEKQESEEFEDFEEFEELEESGPEEPEDSTDYDFGSFDHLMFVNDGSCSSVSEELDSEESESSSVEYESSSEEEEELDTMESDSSSSESDSSLNVSDIVPQEATVPNLTSSMSAEQVPPVNDESDSSSGEFDASSSASEEQDPVESDSDSSSEKLDTVTQQIIEQLPSVNDESDSSSCVSEQLDTVESDPNLSDSEELDTVTQELIVPNLTFLPPVNDESDSSSDSSSIVSEKLDTVPQEIIVPNLTLIPPEQLPPVIEDPQLYNSSDKIVPNLAFSMSAERLPPAIEDPLYNLSENITETVMSSSTSQVAEPPSRGLLNFMQRQIEEGIASKEVDDQEKDGCLPSVLGDSGSMNMDENDVDTVSTEDSNDSSSTPQSAKFKCEVCGSAFGFLGNLKTHVKSHYLGEDFTVTSLNGGYPGLLRCEICKDTFKFFKQLSTHVKGHGLKKPTTKEERQISAMETIASYFSNAESNASYATSEYWNVDTQIDIPVTDESLRSKLNEEKEKKSSFSKTNQILTCSTCGRTFKYSKPYEKHLRSHKYPNGSTMDEKYPRTFSESSTDSIAMSITSSEDSLNEFPNVELPYVGEPLRGSFTCEICSRPFKYLAAFKKHMKTHLIDDSPSKAVKEESPNVRDTLRGSFTCEICSKPFKYLAAFKKHVMMHEIEDSTFPESSKAATSITTPATSSEERKESLNESPNVQSPNVDETVCGAFTCEICSKPFQYLVDFKKHMMNHDQATSSNSSNIEDLPSPARSSTSLSEKQIEHVIDDSTFPESSKAATSITTPATSSEERKESLNESPNVQSPNVDEILRGAFTCEICSRNFTYLTAFEKHMIESHDQAKSLKCSNIEENLPSSATSLS